MHTRTGSPVPQCSQQCGQYPFSPSTSWVLRNHMSEHQVPSPAEHHTLLAQESIFTN